MVTIQVNVTKKDIGIGICSEPGCCPIALALLRTMKKNTLVSVGNEIIEFFKLTSRATAEGASKTPRVADHFIASFDNGINVEPFSFKLRVPNKAAKLFRKSAIIAAA